jgi:hypothetical protein
MANQGFRDGKAEQLSPRRVGFAATQLEKKSWRAGINAFAKGLLGIYRPSAAGPRGSSAESTLDNSL